MIQYDDSSYLSTQTGVFYQARFLVTEAKSEKNIGKRTKKPY